MRLWPAERRYNQMRCPAQQHVKLQRHTAKHRHTRTHANWQSCITLLYKDGTCPAHWASIRDEENGRIPRQEREGAEAEPQKSTQNHRAEGPWGMRQPEHTVETRYKEIWYNHGPNKTPGSRCTKPINHGIPQTTSSLQTIVTTIDFLNLIGRGAV